MDLQAQQQIVSASEQALADALEKVNKVNRRGALSGRCLPIPNVSPALPLKGGDEGGGEVRSGLWSSLISRYHQGFSTDWVGASQRRRNLMKATRDKYPARFGSTFSKRCRDITYKDCCLSCRHSIYPLLLTLVPRAQAEVAMTTAEQRAVEVVKFLVTDNATSLRPGHPGFGQTQVNNFTRIASSVLIKMAMQGDRLFPSLSDRTAELRYSPPRLSLVVASFRKGYASWPRTPGNEQG